MGQPKAHHYIPRTYLRNFADHDGRLHVLLKDKPESTLRLRPEEVAHQRFYYSQPSPAGGLDHGLEMMFSTAESSWSEVSQSLERQIPLNDTQLAALITFIVSLRTRVPAARDAMERVLAESARSAALALEAEGKLPVPPPGMEEALAIKNLQIAVDPHRSLHMMVDAIRGLGPLIDALGFVSVRNSTLTPYMSSDNPVVYFDPRVPDAEVRPYSITLGEDVLLLFPISSSTLVIGSTLYAEHFRGFGISYAEEHDPSSVQKFNRMVARFAYRQAYCKEMEPLEVARDFADTSPVPTFDRLAAHSGEYLIARMVFGSRIPKPRWKR